MELEDQQPEAQQPAVVGADAGSDDLIMLSGISTAELFRKPISSWSRLDLQVDVDLSSDGENSDTGGLSYQSWQDGLEWALSKSNRLLHWVGAPPRKGDVPSLLRSPAGCSVLKDTWWV